MNKLTKEQGEWLIRTIKAASHKEVFEDGNRTLAQIVEDIISQCTEKQLDFCIDVNSFDDGHIEVNVDQKDNTVQILIKDVTDEDEDCCDTAQLWLHENEFKRFVDGCNKIAKWIEKQE